MDTWCLTSTETIRLIRDGVCHTRTSIIYKKVFFWKEWLVRGQELCESRSFRGRKAILNHAHALVSACPWYVNRHPRTLSNATEPNRGMSLQERNEVKTIATFLQNFQSMLAKTINIQTSGCSISTVQKVYEFIWSYSKYVLLVDFIIILSIYSYARWVWP